VKYPFKYYVHDNASGFERAEFIAQQIDGELTDADIDALAADRPFYEVILHCVYDTETKRVSLANAEL
jgi:hypothetical protein